MRWQSIRLTAPAQRMLKYLQAAPDAPMEVHGHAANRSANELRNHKLVQVDRGHGTTVVRLLPAGFKDAKQASPDPGIRTEGNKTPHAHSSPRAKMWQSMRVLRRFRVPELSATAEVGTGSVHSYLRPLVKTGYVRVIKRHQHGWADYALARDTGPHAPRVWRTLHTVYDVNTGQKHNIGDRS